VILVQLNVRLKFERIQSSNVANHPGFQSLLQAIEAEDTEGRIEIHIYLTAKIEYVSSFPKSLSLRTISP